MYLGAAFALSGCGSKSDDTGDGFEVGENAAEDADEESADDDGAGDDSDSTGGGDGSFDVDVLYVMWNGSYRAGAPVAGTYTDEDGAEQVMENTFSFVWIDSADATNENDDYICRLEYDSTSAAVADFTEFDTADTAYMTYMMDLGAVSPTTSGNCDGAAFHFGVEAMTAMVDSTPWGFGYGPMTNDFEDELSGMDGFDYASLGDRPGVTYLRWQNTDGDEFTAWGYFQVIPFVDDTSTSLNLPVTDPSQYLGGVRDNAEPSDGFYYQETIYILQYGG